MHKIKKILTLHWSPTLYQNLSEDTQCILILRKQEKNNNITLSVFVGGCRHKY